MIQEDYCTFGQAKLLKEKGFPQDACSKIEIAGYELGYPTNQLTEFAKPSLSLVQKWLREERDIYIEISKGGYKHSSHCFIDILPNGYIFEGKDIKEFNSYEEALSAGINKALEMI